MIKRVATWLLVALALAGVAVAIKNKAVSPAVVSSPTTAALPDDGVVVTYFTTTARCSSCHKIEELSRQAVAAHFPSEMQSGRVAFRVINTDEAANKHFLNDYQLVSKTVIVSRRESGMEKQWANLQDVWLKLDDSADFDAYVSGAVKKFLEQRGA